MRAILATLSIAFLLFPSAAGAQSHTSSIADSERHLARNPYAYDVRQRLVAEARQADQHALAYYHAAWLAWLGPRPYADSDAGLPLLRDRDARNRAARTRTGPVLVIVAAVESQQLLAKSSLNGSIAQQAGRLHSGTADLLARGEQAAARTDETDPVARIALAHLCLSLDDALALERLPQNDRSRLKLLRQAASRAAAVAAWLPECPGAHRTLAVARARLAEIENRPDFWQLAISAAERAHELDPADPALVESLWILNLRAGKWDQARRWQTELSRFPS